MKKPAIYHMAKEVGSQLKEAYPPRKKRSRLAGLQALKINTEKYACRLQGIPYHPKEELLGRRHRRVRRIEDTFITR